MTVPDQAPSAEPFWLHAHRAVFPQSLADQGYGERGIPTYRRLSGRLREVAAARDIRPDEPDIETMAGLADACPATCPSNGRQLLSVSRRLARHLADAGVMAGTDRPLLRTPWSGSARSGTAGSGSSAGCTGPACDTIRRS